MKQFVPLRDDELYGAIEQNLVLIPYQVGLPCHHALGEAAVVIEPAPSPADQRWNSKASPGLTPSLSAVPPLSSSTYLAGPLLG